MKIKPILSVVYQKAKRNYSGYDYDKKQWIEDGPPTPLNQYIASGGNRTNDLQKAQIFGFSQAAKKRLRDSYKDSELFEVRPVIIKEV